MLDFVLFVQVFVEFVDFVFVYNSDRGTVTNNSPSQDSNHPDDVFQSRNSMMMVIIVMVMVLIMLIMKITITMTITLVVIDEGNYYDTINNKDADVILIMIMLTMIVVITGAPVLILSFSARRAISKIAWSSPSAAMSKVGVTG